MFGSNKPTLFGNNANTSFGSSGLTFGGASATPFGGGATNTAFGTSTFAAQPAAGGLFGGTTSTTPGSSLFGGGTTSVFGQTGQQPQQSAFSFGGTTVTTAQTGGTGGGLFGGTAPVAFGAATQQTSLFGGTQPSAFGAANPAPSAGNTSLFGTSGGSFLGGASGSGTTIKFVPVTGTDVVMKGGSQQTVQTKLQCITGMKEYENKSLEELRAEDYLANRKGPQQQSAFGFGATAAAPATTQTSAFGTFGQAAKPTVTFGGFGGAASSAGSSTLFGQPQAQQSGSLFGGTAFGAAKPLFGTATTTAASNPFGGLSTASTGSSLFGPTQNKGLFGSTATTQSGGLFGSTQSATATPAFGTTFGSPAPFGTSTAQTSGGLFGAKPTGFGQPTGGLFGQTSAAPGTGFGFGQAQPQQQQPTLGGGLFGNKPATSVAGFGGFGTSTGLGFGSTPAASSTGGIGTSAFSFGANTGTSLFGQNKLGIGTTSAFGGGFGSGGGLSFAGTGLPGQTTLGAGLTSFAPSLGTAGQPAVDVIAQQNQQQLLQLTSSPYGDSPLFRNLRHDATKREELMKPTSPAAQKAVLVNGTQPKVGIRPMARIKPKPLQTLTGSGKSQLFDGLEEDESSFEGDSFVPRRSVRKLVINTSRQNMSTRSHSSPSVDETVERGSEGRPELVSRNSKDQQTGQQNMARTSDVDSRQQQGGRVAHVNALNNTVGEFNSRNRIGGLFDISPDNSLVAGRGTNTNGHQQPHDSSSEPDDQSSCLSETEQPSHPSGIVLRRHGYYTMPAIEEIQRDENGRWLVDNFVVGRVGYGNVMFYGSTDVEGLNLDELVHFRRNEIVVYPNDETKPPVGEGLNKKAQVTLDCVWPYDKTTGRVIKDYDRLEAMKYSEKLERMSHRLRAKYLDYRPETGSWVFEVEHFSKYGLLDDSDDECIITAQQQSAKLQQPQQALEIQQQGQVQQQLQANSSLNTLQQFEKQPSEIADSESERPQRGLGGRPLLPEDDEEDTEMPDINRERFPGAVEEREEVHDEDEAMDVFPMSHNLARSLGVLPAQVQLQKASFFASDDDFEDVDRRSGLFSRGPQLFQNITEPLIKGAAGSPWGSLTPPVDKPQATKRRSAAVPRGQQPFRDIEGSTPPPSIRPGQFPYQEHMLIPSGMTESTTARRPVIGNRIRRNIPSMEKSLVAKRSSLLMDIGLFHGRRFRVGWAPRSINVRISNLDNTSKDQSSLMDTSCTFLMDAKSLLMAKKSLTQRTEYEVSIGSVSALDFITADSVGATASALEARLQIQLQNSENRSDGECPLFTPSLGTKLLKDYAAQAQNEDIKSGTTVSASAVWDLCIALWGDLDEFSPAIGMDQQLPEDSYKCQQIRREALSRWLSARASEFIEREVSVDRKDRDEAGGVFSYMTGRMIEQACDLALSNGDLHLAMLITQAIGSDDIRQLMRRQLEAWSQNEMDRFIDRDRLKIASLLAGTLFWKTSDKDDNLVNTCASLDWKRCFALHLWYHCAPTATIADALAAYEKSISGQSPNGKYSAPPLPVYLELIKDAEYDESRVRDVCYHLLKLYCDRTQPLNVLLNPSSITDNNLDYSLSWHLMQVLSSLGYNNLSVVHHAAVCESYASQLESMGLWHWAVFVLSHLYDYDIREYAIKQTLMRHVCLRDAVELDKEHFLIEFVRIPAEWIHEAKAVRAKSEGNHVAEAWHLLKAKKWNKAHSLVIEFIAPDAVINDNCDALYECYLKPLSDLARPGEIKDWVLGGSLFLDYTKMLHLYDQFDQMDGAMSDYDLETLHSLATSVGTRLSRVQSSKTVETVCHCAMSKNVAKVMIALLNVKNRNSMNQLHHAASLLDSLSLPENDRREFLDHTSHVLLCTATASS